MADDTEFITRLIGFGLSEKEAQVYVHLLKYGPKPPSLLAKSLKTYREDVYRTLTGLIDKGMVTPSLETPTVYMAVDLDAALDMALKKRESELREMEMRKRELQEISKEQRFRPSDEFTKFRIFKSLKEAVANMISGLTSTEKEVLFVIPGPVIVVGLLFGIKEAAKKLIERGGHIRGICDVTNPIIEHVQEQLDMGQDVRHFSQYRGIYFGVFDRKYCVSSINIDFKHMSLDEPLSAFYTDDTTYVNSLISTFEILWEQSVPAAQRIEELLNEGPPQG
jgi:sugar-specific transcriptional regulator TrmB